MLSIFDGNRSINRRQLLSIGSLGLAGLGLPSLLRASATSPAHVTGKSVIFLFQQGGPSQFETFDPKVDAPDAIRTVTDTVQTSLPGVHFGEHMSRLATIADKFTVVRSYQTNNGGHNIQPIVGPDSLNTNIGVHYSHVVGPTEPRTGMPTNAVIYPSAVSEDVPGPQARGNLSSTGSYGSSHAPFVPGKDGQLQKDMKLNLPRERFFGDRKQLLAKLDRLKRQVDADGQVETLDELQQQAYEVLLGGGVAQALDLSREDKQVVQRYDTARYVRSKDQWNRVSRGRSGYYTANASSIGKLLLLARRLCQAGCGFVTIHASYAGVWDMHADGNNLTMREGMDAIGYSYAHAVAAFIEDLERLGLTDEILLVTSGEMGRTPRINKNGGRDHWGRLAPLLIHGGGTRPGQVIGQSDRQGGEPITSRYTPANLISTIMNTVFNVGQLRLVPSVSDQVMKLANEKPIPLA
tara:strand:- start:197 stop:1591 length:1395 start_codon:yes stop_codon:yes gene_type:complete